MAPILHLNLPLYQVARHRGQFSEVRPMRDIPSGLLPPSVETCCHPICWAPCRRAYLMRLAATKENCPSLSLPYSFHSPHPRPDLLAFFYLLTQNLTMAEAAGLAFAIVSLATAFDSVVNCFEYIHLGKEFDSDFQDCVLKLDNARLRLSRWGEAVGLDQVEKDTVSLNDTKLSKKNIPKAKERLDFILDEIEKVKRLSGRFDESLVVSPESRLNPAAMFLHKKMRRLAKMRGNHLSMPETIRWAVYDRGHFRDMIGKIGDHTKELQELFPAAKPLEKALVDKETLELSESIKVLKDAIKEQDKTLASALDALLKPLVSFLARNSCPDAFYLTGLRTNSTRLISPRAQWGLARPSKATSSRTFEVCRTNDCVLALRGASLWEDGCSRDAHTMIALSSFNMSNSMSLA